jgi:hypothetical protein
MRGSRAKLTFVARLVSTDEKVGIRGVDQTRHIMSTYSPWPAETSWSSVSTTEVDVDDMYQQGGCIVASAPEVAYKTDGYQTSPWS